MSVVWSPLPGGSPRVKGNFPGNYWPGSRWVDWVGTDFYSQYPVWKDLNRFYGGVQWQNKPVAITEWAVAPEDEPRFAKQLVSWTVKRRGCGCLSTTTASASQRKPVRPQPLPRTTNTLRLKLRRANFLSVAEYDAASCPHCRQSQRSRHRPPLPARCPSPQRRPSRLTGRFPSI